MGPGGDTTATPVYTVPFSASVAVPNAKGATQLVLALEARTDKGWQDAANAEGDSPKKPQTHLARARSDPTWYGRNGPYEIVGAVSTTAVVRRMPCAPAQPLSVSGLVTGSD